MSVARHTSFMAAALPALDPASREAARIAWLTWLFLGVCAVVFALVLAWLLVVIVREWRLAGDSPLDRFAAATERIRFMAMLGIMTSALFFLVTAAQVLANLFILPGKT